jgi:hypothetical protein
VLVVFHWFLLLQNSVGFDSSSRNIFLTFFIPLLSHPPGFHQQFLVVCITKLPVSHTTDQKAKIVELLANSELKSASKEWRVITARCNP